MFRHVQTCPHADGVRCTSSSEAMPQQTALRSSSLDDVVNYGLDKEVTHKAEQHKAITADVVINTLHSNVYVSGLAALCLHLNHGLGLGQKQCRPWCQTPLTARAESSAGALLTGISRQTKLFLICLALQTSNEI